MTLIGNTRAGLFENFAEFASTVATAQRKTIPHGITRLLSPGSVDNSVGKAP